PINQMFVDAALLHQLRLNPDYNGAEQEGAFMYQVTQKNGERCSAAKAYLTPNLTRPNLRVLTRAASSRVVVENRRATGVTYTQGAATHTVGARREVIVSAGAFLRSRPDLGAPDLQLIFVIGIVDDHARKQHLGHGISCHVDVLRPYSRGEVRLASREAREAPLIDPRFLEDERDLELLVRGAQTMQRIMESPPLDGVRGKMLYPMRADDAAGIAADIRKLADTQYHPVGTCKMGPDSDPMAVVDAQLRVRGIDNLRVADAAVMPTL